MPHTGINQSTKALEVQSPLTDKQSPLRGPYCPIHTLPRVRTPEGSNMIHQTRSLPHFLDVIEVLQTQDRRHQTVPQEVQGRLINSYKCMMSRQGGPVIFGKTSPRKCLCRNSWKARRASTSVHHFTPLVGSSDVECDSLTFSMREDLRSPVSHHLLVPAS